MSKEWFIKEGGQVCFKSDDAELNGWDTQSLVDCLNGKEIKIADLEAKLAKRDETIDEINKNFLSAVKDWKQLVEIEKAEKDQLKQQLAEKDHTINTLIEDHKASQEWYKMQIADTEAQNKRVLEKLDIIVRSNQELEKQHDIDNQVIQLMEDNREKDKISFCIEQLEKVKELLFSKAIQITGTSVDSVRLYSINEIFSNQIQQLKEMKW